MAVLGVDACKGGWVGVRWVRGDPPDLLWAPEIGTLVAAAGAVEVVGIDIPIGLPVDRVRVAERLARAVLGPRASSLFIPPPRVVLEERDHATASDLCRALIGQGVSRQAHALGPKVLEVEDWLLGGAAIRVVEVHPEVSFATLAGRSLAEPKTTWAGFQLRRRLLDGEGLGLGDGAGLEGRRVGVDDVLDAAAIAWTADRVARGGAVSYPDPPEDLGGIPAAIWA